MWALQWLRDFFDLEGKEFLMDRLTPAGVGKLAVRKSEAIEGGEATTTITALIPLDSLDAQLQAFCGTEIKYAELIQLPFADWPNFQNQQGKCLLAFAIENQYLSILEKLKQEGVDLAHTAYSYQGKMELLKIWQALKKQEIDLSYIPHSGTQIIPLLHAIFGDHEFVVEWLLTHVFEWNKSRQALCSVEQQGLPYSELMLLAITANNLNILMLLHSKNPSSFNQGQIDWVLALNLAVKYSNLKILEYLLQQGDACKQAWQVKIVSPLHFAVMDNKPEQADLLLQMIPRLLYVQDSLGSYAAEFLKTTEMLEILDKHGMNWMCFTRNSYKNRAEIDFRRLLRSGASEAAVQQQQALITALEQLTLKCPLQLNFRPADNIHSLASIFSLLPKLLSTELFGTSVYVNDYQKFVENIGKSPVARKKLEKFNEQKIGAIVAQTNQVGHFLSIKFVDSKQKTDGPNRYIIEIDAQKPRTQERLMVFADTFVNTKALLGQWAIDHVAIIFDFFMSHPINFGSPENLQGWVLNCLMHPGEMRLEDFKILLDWNFLNKEALLMLIDEVMTHNDFALVEASLQQVMSGQEVGDKLRLECRQQQWRQSVAEYKYQYLSAPLPVSNEARLSFIRRWFIELRYNVNHITGGQIVYMLDSYRVKTQQDVVEGIMGILQGVYLFFQMAVELEESKQPRFFKQAKWQKNFAQALKNVIFINFKNPNFELWCASMRAAKIKSNNKEIWTDMKALIEALLSQSGFEFQELQEVLTLLTGANQQNAVVAKIASLEDAPLKPSASSKAIKPESPTPPQALVIAASKATEPTPMTVPKKSKKLKTLVEVEEKSDAPLAKAPVEASKTATSVVKPKLEFEPAPIIVRSLSVNKAAKQKRASLPVSKQPATIDAVELGGKIEQEQSKPQLSPKRFNKEESVWFKHQALKQVVALPPRIEAAELVEVEDEILSQRSDSSQSSWPTITVASSISPDSEAGVFSRSVSSSSLMAQNVLSDLTSDQVVPSQKKYDILAPEFVPTIGFLPTTTVHEVAVTNFIEDLDHFVRVNMAGRSDRAVKIIEAKISQLMDVFGQKEGFLWLATTSPAQLEQLTLNLAQLATFFGKPALMNQKECLAGLVLLDRFFMGLYSYYARVNPGLPAQLWGTIADGVSKIKSLVEGEIGRAIYFPVTLNGLEVTRAKFCRIRQRKDLNDFLPHEVLIVLEALQEIESELNFFSSVEKVLAVTGSQAWRWGFNPKRDTDVRWLLRKFDGNVSREDLSRLLEALKKRINLQISYEFRSSDFVQCVIKIRTPVAEYEIDLTVSASTKSLALAIDDFFTLGKLSKNVLLPVGETHRNQAITCKQALLDFVRTELTWRDYGYALSVLATDELGSVLAKKFILEMMIFFARVETEQDVIAAKQDFTERMLGKGMTAAEAEFAYLRARAVVFEQKTLFEQAEPGIPRFCTHWHPLMTDRRYSSIRNVQGLLAILAEGWPIYYQDEHGDSIFHCMIAFNNIEMLQQIVATLRNRNVSEAAILLLMASKNHEGETPLSLARKHGFIELVHAFERVQLRLSRLQEVVVPMEQVASVFLDGRSQDFPQNPTFDA